MRGEECVSLGWCFWHRACYGCLFCGSRSVVRGVRIDELFRDDGCEGGESNGKEVEEVPLCGNCAGEVEMGDWDKKEVVRRGVGRVEREDGMARTRWEITERTQGGVHPADTAVDEAGLRKEVGEGKGEGGTIYVSMLDPIGIPSFRPNLTKPVPRCMQPAGRIEEAEVAAFGSRQVVEMAETSDTQSDGSSGASAIRPPADKGDGEEEQLQPPRRLSIYSDITVRSRRSIKIRGASYVSTEPLMLPSSQLLERYCPEMNLSSSTIALYDTPPRCASPTPLAQAQATEEGLEPSNSKTPTDRAGISLTNPLRLPTKGHRSSGASSLLRRLSKGSQSVCSSSRPGSRRPSQSSTPLTSNEYIERYQLGTAASIPAPPGSAQAYGEPFPMRRDGALKGRIVAKLHKAGPRPGPG